MDSLEPAQIPLSELYTGFESLGNNCEFGIVQRANGFDPPGLFRNVGFDYVEALIAAVEQNLDGMFDDGAYEFTLPPGWHDWRFDDKKHGFLFHTSTPNNVPRESEEWQKKAKETVATFRFLKRLFQDELEEGEKIFVFRMIKPLDMQLVRRLAAAIRKRGPGWLLYIRQDEAYPDGMVELVEDGLMMGAIDRLSNENPPVINSKAWETIAREALRLRGG